MTHRARSVLEGVIMNVGKRQERDAVSSIRSQTALVRALLDEIERVAPSGADEALCEQLVDELERLGSRCMELAQIAGSRTSQRGVRSA